MIGILIKPRCLREDIIEILYLWKHHIKHLLVLRRKLKKWRIINLLRKLRWSMRKILMKEGNKLRGIKDHLLSDWKKLTFNNLSYYIKLVNFIQFIYQ
jgi:hypothetical protein